MIDQSVAGKPRDVSLWTEVSAGGRSAARVWPAFRELGRSTPTFADVVAEVDTREQALMRRVLPAADDAEPDAVAALHAVSLGLRDAVCRSVDPLEMHVAERVMRRLAEAGRQADRTGEREGE